MKVNVDGIEYIYDETKKKMDYFIYKVAQKKQELVYFFGIDVTDVKMYFISKEELDNQVKKTSINFKGEVPIWLVGFTIYNTIYIVYPHKNNVEYMMKVAVHELVHCFVNKLNNNSRLPLLLSEGIAKFLADQFTSFTYDKIKNDIIEDKVPKLLELCVNNPDKQTLETIYTYSYVFIKYLLEKNKKDMLMEYLCKRKNFIEDITTHETQFRKYVKNIIENE